MKTIADALEYYGENFFLGEEDPEIFVRKLVSPSNWINPLTGNVEEMRPNGPQLQWMRNSNKAKNIWAAGNSTGKSFGSAFKANWFAIYKKKPGRHWESLEAYLQAPYKVLLTGPESKQAMSLFEQVEFQLRNSTFLSMMIVNITMGTKRDPHARIELSNGTTIHAVSTKGKGVHIESGDYDLIVFDEPADEPHLNFVIDKVLEPRMFRRGGILDLVGTPKGNPQFYDYYVMGASPKDEYYDPQRYDKVHFYSQNNSSDENPFADQSSISIYKDSKDPKMVEERIKGKFVSFSDVAFTQEMIENVIDYDMQEEYKPSTNRVYVTGVDFGRKNDFTVAFTLDVTERPYKMMHFGRWGGGVVSWQFIFNELYGIFKTYNSEFLVDATSSGGDMQCEWLNELGIFYKPYVYTPGTKVKLINNLQDAMSQKLFRVAPIQALKEELRFYPRDLDDKKVPTDCVMALALAVLKAKEYGSVGEPYDY